MRTDLRRRLLVLRRARVVDRTLKSNYQLTLFLGPARAHMSSNDSEREFGDERERR